MQTPNRLPLRPPPALEPPSVSVAPPSPKVRKTTVSMESDTWERLQEAARVLSEEARADGRKPFARDDVIEHACKRWLEEWEQERAAKRRR